MPFGFGIGQVSTDQIADGSITNAKVNAAAAIARTKLSFGAGLVDADIAAAAAIARTKLSFGAGLVDADIAAAAAIAMSKLSLAITDTEVAAGAALAWTKVSKTGSNLTDIATRSHTSLSDVGTNAHATIDAHLVAASPHSGHARSPQYFSYAGDSTDNRAIAHGFGAVPSIATIQRDDGGIYGVIFGGNPTKLFSYQGASVTVGTVTAMDATNIYVSESGTIYANNNTRTYYVVVR